MIRCKAIFSKKIIRKMGFALRSEVFLKEMSLDFIEKFWGMQKALKLILNSITERPLRFKSNV
ncbi:MAG: hypothetical protein LBB11_04330 [Puniceicoccales bacterium]|nr:hypothetical protein [Puniceicoccales bacterium]